MSDSNNNGLVQDIDVVDSNRLWFSYFLKCQFSDLENITFLRHV